jgi:hypothetical protein
LITDTDADGPRDWANERQRLLARHPRSTWRDARSERVRFWLDVHERLRRTCDALCGTVDDYRALRIRAAELAIRTAPPLHALLADLHDHHRAEDFDYFPTLRRQEPLLVPAFDALERDHLRLGEQLARARAALGALEDAAQRHDATTLALAAGHYADALTRACGQVRLHLHDEEDVVVPLLLERGDG